VKLLKDINANVAVFKLKIIKGSNFMEKLVHVDKYNVSDVIKNPGLLNVSPGYGIKGIVYRILVDDKVVDGGMENLVIANGRRFAAQAITKKKNASDGTDVSAYLIKYFGIGSGGSTIADPPVLTGPDVCDLDLTTPIPFSSSNAAYLTSPSEGQNTAYVAKAIETDGSIEVIANTDLSGCGHPYDFTWIKNTCVKVAGEPDNIGAGATVKIDEACLYYINTGLTDIHTFAHICFYPKWIEKESQFTIEWYILC